MLVSHRPLPVMSRISSFPHNMDVTYMKTRSWNWLLECHFRLDQWWLAFARVLLHSAKSPPAVLVLAACGALSTQGTKGCVTSKERMTDTVCIWKDVKWRLYQNLKLQTVTNFSRTQTQVCHTSNKSTFVTFRKFKTLSPTIMSVIL